MRGRLAQMLGAFGKRGGKSLAKAIDQLKPDPVQQYIAGGRIPWSEGYSKYRTQLIRDAFQNEALMTALRLDQPLPAGHGVGVDERSVECAWAIAKLKPGTGRILDAGSVMNKPMFLDLPQLRERDIVIYSLDMNWIHLNPRVSYLFGDFRDPILKDEIFESIVCVSTLEHVGMNTYPIAPFEEWIQKPQVPKDKKAPLGVIREFRRMLKPGGQLLITVPFGRAQDLDWLQQFDHAGIREMIEAFHGECRTEAYYRYLPTGWQRATAEECAENSHVDVIRPWARGAKPDHGTDGAASARSIACLELVRP